MGDDVTLAILAGGAGTRMGGPKAWMTLDGQPILTRLLDRLQWPGPTLLVTAPGRERPPGHERFDAEATDAVADDGPLRGLLTALDATTTPMLVVVPVDMPNLTADASHWLVEQLASRPNTGGVMLRNGDRIEPMPAAFRVASMRPIVRQLLSAGTRAMRTLADEVDVIQCPSDWPATMWLNLNRPADVVAFDSAARGSIA